MYYFILALVEIGLFLSENWKELTGTAIATGIGVILGKRLGTRIAINYIMRTLGLEKKSKLERQVAWLIELERGRGNIWNAERKDSDVFTVGRKSLYAWKMKFRAQYVNASILRKGIFYSRRKRTMSKWIKPDKLAIILGTLITASNEYFGWALDTENVAAFFFMIFTFFKQQEIVKIVRYAHGLPVAFKINSTKLVFTVLGVLIVALDQVKGMGLGLPEIITIAGFVSGYNIKEGNEDVKKSEAEAQGNQFH